MATPRNVALTVHELEAGEFYWVIMEAVDDRPDMPDSPHADAAATVDAAAGTTGTPGETSHVYVPLEAAHEPYATYSNALVAGVAVMRRLFGTDGAKAGSL
jgi:hypothetical protein